MLNGICPKCNFLVTRKLRDRQHAETEFFGSGANTVFEQWREYSCPVCRHVWYVERTWNGWIKGTPPEGLFDE
jgi:hypothetical protein